MEVLAGVGREGMYNMLMENAHPTFTTFERLNKSKVLLGAGCRLS